MPPLRRVLGWLWIPVPVLAGLAATFGAARVLSMATDTERYQPFSGLVGIAILLCVFWGVVRLLGDKAPDWLDAWRWHRQSRMRERDQE